MKKILLILSLFCAAAIAQSQNIRNQSYIWTANQSFSDSIKMSGLFGSGTVVRIDEDGYLYKASGTNIDTIPIGQVTNLRQALDSQQIQLAVDSNFVLSAAGKLDLNNTVWVEIVRASDEIYLENNIPVFEIKESDGSLNNKRWQFRGETETLRLQAISDTGAGGGDFVDFTRSGNNITSMRFLDNAVSRIDIKNSGTILVEDTVRTGQLKAADLLYPLADGTSGQVISTNGTGTLSFIDFPPSYVAGTNITISNDTINASAVSDSDWSVNGNYVYNTTDSIGIGTVSPAYAFDVRKFSNFQNVGNVMRAETTIGTAISVTSNGGNALAINGVSIDSVSTRNVVNSTIGRTNELVSEYTLKSHVDTMIKKRTRISWAKDVDTSGRVDGFVLKWDNGNKTHFYDTAGTGGGGATYFRGQGLTLSANTFAIGDDSVRTAMVQDDAVTYSKIQNVGGNSVLARTAAGSGDLSEVALSLENLVGRGNSGNVTNISIGTGLAFSGTQLQATNTGDITGVSAGNGLTGGGSSGAVTLTLGTPTSVNSATSNSVTTTSHSHEINFAPVESYTFFYDSTRHVGGTGQRLSVTGEREKVVLSSYGSANDSSQAFLGRNIEVEVSGRVTFKLPEMAFDSIINVVVKVYYSNSAPSLGADFSSGTLVSTGIIRGTMPIQIVSQYSTPTEGATLILTPPEGASYLTLPIPTTKFTIEGASGIDQLFVTATSSSGLPIYVLHKQATMEVKVVAAYDGGNEMRSE